MFAGRGWKPCAFGERRDICVVAEGGVPLQRLEEGGVVRNGGGMREKSMSSGQLLPAEGMEV